MKALDLKDTGLFKQFQIVSDPIPSHYGTATRDHIDSHVKAFQKGISDLSSREVREKLDEWFKNSEYTDIKFSLSPNSNASQEAMEVELLTAVLDMEEQKKNGTLKLIPLSEFVL